jgi:AraC-like DNA-binding protein/ligand-binding sensor protein
MTQPDSYIGPVDFAYLAGSTEFAQFTRLLRRWGGIIMSLRDAGGDRVHDTDEADHGSPLCKLIDGVPRGHELCRRCDAKYLARAAKLGRALRYRCHAGLIDIAVPITVDGQHVASMSSGQVLPAPHNPKDAERFVRRLRGLGIAPERIRKAYWNAPYLDPQQLDATVELLTFFARYLCEVRLTLREMVTRMQRPEITAAQQFIEQHCADPLTLARVAARVGLSPAHFSGVFHRETKMTFTAYVQHRRAAQVARQLRDGHRRITDICFVCGFNSLTHLNRVFRKFYGCSPLQYRRAKGISTFISSRRSQRLGVLARPATRTQRAAQTQPLRGGGRPGRRSERPAAAQAQM